MLLRMPQVTALMSLRPSRTMLRRATRTHDDAEQKDAGQDAAAQGDAGLGDAAQSDAGQEAAGEGLRKFGS